MDKTRIAVIGCGGVAKSHVKAFLALKDKCEIVALCNTHTQKCEKLIEEFSLDKEKLTVTSDYNAILSRNDIDLD